MSLSFKYIPLTFLKDVNIIKDHIKNTVILRYLFDEYGDYSKLENLITGTQYGYNASALQSGRNKFLRISDITDGKVNWNTVPFCDCSDEDTYLLNKNDLLIARTGGTTGKSFIIDNPPEKSIFAGYLIRIRANQENNPEYLNIFLNSYVYWSQVVSMNKGEFRPSVNATKLKDLIVPKVDLEIQKNAINISKGLHVNGYEALENNIAIALNEFYKSQEIIKHCSIQLQNAALLKQSILQEAIQGKLTADWRAENPNAEPASELLKRIKEEKNQLIKENKIKKEKSLPPITEEEVPFELPDSWVWCRFGDLVNISSGDGLTSKQMVSGDIPVFGGNGINGYHNKFNTSEVTVTIGRVGAYCGAVHLTPQYAWITDNCFRVYFDQKSIFQSYLIWHLKYLNLGKASYDGSQPVISGKRVYPLLTFLPPFEEQKAIVEKLEILMHKCTELEEETTTSEANAQMLMQVMLKEAFEGKQEVIEI